MVCTLDTFLTKVKFIYEKWQQNIIDGSVKSRHPVEKRGPVLF